MNSFQTEAFEAHNDFRKHHGAPPLRFSEKLSKSCEKYAKDLSKLGLLRHSEKLNIGENLASIKGGDLNGKAVTELWYNEKSNYDYSKPESTNTTGNFTQMVWVNSAKFGIFKNVSKDGTVYVVARYSPPGNFVEMFNENVLPEGTEMKQRTESPTVAAINIPDQKELKKKMLKYVNFVRESHGVSHIKWDEKICQDASKYAKDVLDSKINKTEMPAPSSQYGQILLMSTGGLPSVKHICRSWYNGFKKYDFTSGSFSQETGAFSQLVWGDSKSFGVGISKDQKEHVVVAYFDPPGNIRGKFDENVKPLAAGKNNPFK